jgi:hypothetical protein
VVTAPRETATIPMAFARAPRAPNNTAQPQRTQRNGEFSRRLIGRFEPTVRSGAEFTFLRPAAARSEILFVSFVSFVTFVVEQFC